MVFDASSQVQILDSKLLKTCNLVSTDNEVDMALALQLQDEEVSRQQKFEASQAQRQDRQQPITQSQQPKAAGQKQAKKPVGKQKRESSPGDGKAKESKCRVQ